jgi:hypothetical protein
MDTANSLHSPLRTVIYYQVDPESDEQKQKHTTSLHLLTCYIVYHLRGISLLPSLILLQQT